MRVVAPTWNNDNRYYILRTKYSRVKPTNLKAKDMWLWIYKSFVHRVGHFQFYLSLAVNLSSQEVASTLPCWICFGLMASFDQQEEESAAWCQLPAVTQPPVPSVTVEKPMNVILAWQNHSIAKAFKRVMCCIAYTKAFLTFQTISDAV